jgi:hypothetical protein
MSVAKFLVKNVSEGPFLEACGCAHSRWLYSKVPTAVPRQSQRALIKHDHQHRNWMPHSIF